MRKKLVVFSIIALFIVVPLAYLMCIYPRAMFNPVLLEPSETVDELAQQINEKSTGLLRTYGIPGLAISFISNNNTDTFIKGRADYWKKQPLNQDHYFQLASVSKSQCAFAIMKLVEEGLVDIDVPVETYLTRWALPENGFDNDEVTIRRILCHAAGLSVSGVPGVLNQQNLLSIEDALTEADVKVIAEPGSTYMYSGGGYGILQLIIEEVTGQNYAEYLKASIFNPLGLNNTYTQWRDEFSSEIARGHGTFYFHSLLSFSPFQAAAGHYTNILDFTKWCESFIYGQSVLNSSLVDLMLTPQFGENWGYTLGFEWKKLANNISIFGHNGDNWGYHSSFRFCRTTGEGIVILTNGDRGALLRDQILAEWESIIGENNVSETTSNERFVSITAAVLVLFVFLIMIIILGLKFNFLKFDFPVYNYKDSSRRRKIFLILRPITTALLFCILIFLIFLLGWSYGSASYAPFYFIWIDVIIFTTISWSIPASQLLQVEVLEIWRKLRK